MKNTFKTALKPSPQEHHKIACLLNQDLQFTQITDHGAKLHGYRNAEHMIGTSLFDIKCSLIKSAPDFYQQFKKAMNQERRVSMLDLHTYADGQTHITRTDKTPLYDTNDQVCGAFAQVCIITGDIEARLYNKCFSNANNLLDSKHPVNITMEMITHYDDLTVRESECMYYIMRGESSRMISERLSLSARTIEEYTNALKIKLNCTNKSDLLHYGLAYGLNKQIPQSLLQ